MDDGEFGKSREVKERGGGGLDFERGGDASTFSFSLLCCLYFVVKSEKKKAKKIQNKKKLIKKRYKRYSTVHSAHYPANGTHAHARTHAHLTTVTNLCGLHPGNLRRKRLMDCEMHGQTWTIKFSGD